MRRGFFVTGTDTGVGKTVASAALMLGIRRAPFGQSPVRYWKPVQTGIEQDDDTAEVKRLGACAGEDVLDRGVRLMRPLSPHLSARIAGTAISVESIMQAGAPDIDRGTWIVEGAGGVLVPLNDSELMIDLMTRLALPVVVVARTALGTINHTLLTLEALRSRRLAVAGAMLIGEANAANRDAIVQHGRVRILGEMPRFTALTAEALDSWARTHLHLAEALSQ